MLGGRPARWQGDRLQGRGEGASRRDRCLLLDRVAVKTVRDAGNKKIMQDPRMKMGDEMPFDGKRLIFGGFELLLDTE